MCSAPISRNDIHITDHGIAKLLPNLDPSKAAGPDELKPKILKELAHNISPVLCLIFKIFELLLCLVLRRLTGIVG
jgi:hypothetical protein